MKKFSIFAALFMSLSLLGPVYAQRTSQVHELFPFIGLYAPDRFQSSLTFGARYEYHIDSRFSFGATVGIAKAGQNFFQKIGGPAPEQGSSTVLYYSGRVTQAFPVGTVIPYGTVGLGIVRQHSDSNLAFSLGIGTKIPFGETTFIRWEMNDHIFTSGQGNTSWTNNNLEFSVGLSFFLQ